MLSLSYLYASRALVLRCMGLESIWQVLLLHRLCGAAPARCCTASAGHVVSVLGLPHCSRDLQPLLSSSCCPAGCRLLRGGRAGVDRLAEVDLLHVRPCSELLPVLVLLLLLSLVATKQKRGSTCFSQGRQLRSCCMRRLANRAQWAVCGLTSSAPAQLLRLQLVAPHTVPQQDDIQLLHSQPPGPPGGVPRAARG